VSCWLAEEIVIDGPRIRGDSIFSGAEATPFAGVALAELTGLEVRRSDPGQTALGIVVAGAMIVVATFACLGLVSPCGSGS